nr:hypothetical protein [uncultured Methanoregula sp.]
MYVNGQIVDIADAMDFALCMQVLGPVPGRAAALDHALVFAHGYILPSSRSIF